VAKVVPSALQQDALPLSGKRVVFRSTKWGWIAAKWPKKRGRPRTPYQRYHQAEFGIAARYAASPEGNQAGSAELLSQGVQMVPRDFLTMAALGIAMAVTLEDGTKLVPGRMAQANPQYILDLITSTINSVLYRSTLGWIGVAPLADGQVLSFIGGQIQFANPATPPAANGWAVIGSWTWSTNVSGVNFNVAGYSEVCVIFRAVACSASTFRTVVASVDGGSTFYRTSGNYVEVENVGTEAAKASWGTHVTGASAARSLVVNLYSINTSGQPKASYASSRETRLFVASTSPVNYIRCEPGTGNFTAGSIYVLGRA
jgi:hypothetical protein